MFRIETCHLLIHLINLSDLKNRSMMPSTIVEPPYNLLLHANQYNYVAAKVVLSPLNGGLSINEQRGHLLSLISDNFPIVNCPTFLMKLTKQNKTKYSLKFEHRRIITYIQQN